LAKTSATLYGKNNLAVLENMFSALVATKSKIARFEIIIPVRMRKCYAWLLLFVTTVQWVGGHLYFEVTQLVEMEQAMSEPEQAISNEIYEETGIEANVNILPKGRQVRWGADYGNYFAYEKTIGTDTVAFTIDYSPRTATWEQVAGQLPNDQQDDAPYSTFAKFLFGAVFFEPVSQLNNPYKGHPDSNFSLCIIHGRLSTSPFSPPPDFHC
jgi:hypothetical protein